MTHEQIIGAQKLIVFNEKEMMLQNLCSCSYILCWPKSWYSFCNMHSVWNEIKELNTYMYMNKSTLNNEVNAYQNIAMTVTLLHVYIISHVNV